MSFVAKWRFSVVSKEHFPAAWSGQTAVITATGEIDLTNADWLRDALLSALNAGATGLVVDLTTVTFLDSAGVDALVRATRRAAALAAALRVAATTQPVLRVLDLVGLDQLVPVYPNVARALASLPAAETVSDSSTRPPPGPDATPT